MKKILAMLLSVAIIATIAIGGSIAYLQDTDSTVNTMVMGNVDIEQIEQERDAEGKLVAFQNGQKLYPAHYNTHTEASDDLTAASEPAEKDEDGFYKGIAGAMDKIVHVENVGKSEAYIRVWFAFEADDADTIKYIHPNWNTSNATGAIAPVEYNNGTAIAIGADGNKYVVYSVTYPEAIQPGAATANSLLEVFMDKAATNEYVEQFGDTYEILVLSQGVQAENFENAEQALNAAFGEKAPWDENTTVAVPTFIKTAEELKAALNSIGTLGKNETLNIVLGADISLKDYNWDLGDINITDGKTVVINGNGHTISDLNKSYSDNGGLLPYVYMEGGHFTVKNLNLKNFTIKGTNSKTSNDEAGSAGGALIGYFNNWCDEETKFENVNVVGASIEGFKYLGGLVGYQTIYNDNHAGLTLSECSVTGSTLNSTFYDDNEYKGHVGGLIGHFQRGAMTNNTVKDTVITGSTDAKRAGALGGTVYEVTPISGNECINVTINGVGATDSTGNQNLLGAASSANAVAAITGTSISTTGNTIVSNSAALASAISAGTNTITLTAGTYTPTETLSNVTIVGSGDKGSVKFDKIINTYKDVKFSNVTFNEVSYLYSQGTTVFENCVFAGTNGNYSFHAEDIKGTLKFVNCVFENKPVTCGILPTSTDPGNVVFENCTFNSVAGYWGNVTSYCNTTMNNCTFNLNGTVHRLTNNVTITVNGGNYFNKVVWKGAGTVVNGESST